MKGAARALCGSLLMVACAGHAAPPVDAVGVACGDAPPWRLYEAYRARFVQADGRVVDHTGGGHSTSEGQAYALFHALVAGDRTTFDRVLAWMETHLAQGDLQAHLPGWKWGQDAQGAWRLLDEHAASDADLWAAYALVEAGRLWEAPELRARGLGLLAQVAEQEVVGLADLGPSVLPGPVGFQLEDGTTRLNPSYLPVQVLRRLAGAGAPGPWAEVLPASVALIVGASHDGFVPDWIAHRPGVGLVTDPVAGPLGSYDAIRVYLWAGLLSDEDDDKATLATRLDGPLRFWRRHGRVPERVDARLGVAFEGAGNVGFLAALLPDVAQRGRPRELGRLREAIEAERGPDGLYGSPPAYYEQNLLLFALGQADGAYHFGPDGRLHPRWAAACEAGTP